MRNSIFNRLLPKRRKQSFLRSLVAGSLYRVSDIRSNTSFSDIKTQIDTMRALANDSQISTALSYYATDATTTNTAGDIIWASPVDDKYKDVADIINQLFKRWNVNEYARDHILELATIGNLYIPTTEMYRSSGQSISSHLVTLDNNTIVDDDFDIIPSTRLLPEDVIHLYYRGEPSGYIYQPSDDDLSRSEYVTCPESAIIHFSLGGLLGDYTIDTIDNEGKPKIYDIKFANPLMDKAVQPTQTLSLLEDANVLSSLNRIIKFINVDCGTGVEETEIIDTLQQFKDKVEQQLSLNTVTGDAQSFVNPQSPNNLIYLPKVNGSDAISITDLNMSESTETDNKLLQYYQDKKLSVLGVPKEAMNFSSNEGLGGAGSVLSQRSALYANSLQRLETAYKAGWKDGLNKYFIAKGMSGFVDKFQLNMQPIITTQSTITFDKRDAALSQASTLIQVLKDIGVTDNEPFKSSLVEILSEVFPQIGSDVVNWNLDLSEGGESDEF